MKYFEKVCGYNADQGQCYGKDRAGADTEDFGIRRFNASVRSELLCPQK